MDESESESKIDIKIESNPKNVDILQMNNF